MRNYLPVTAGFLGRSTQPHWMGAFRLSLMDRRPELVERFLYSVYHWWHEIKPLPVLLLHAVPTLGWLMSSAQSWFRMYKDAKHMLINSFQIWLKNHFLHEPLEDWQFSVCATFTSSLKCIFLLNLFIWLYSLNIFRVYRGSFFKKLPCYSINTKGL